MKFSKLGLELCGFLALAIFSFSATASAEDVTPEDCKADFEKLCPDTELNFKNMKKCFKDKTGELSEGCKEKWDAVSAPLGKKGKAKKDEPGMADKAKAKAKEKGGAAKKGAVKDAGKDLKGKLLGN